MKKKKTTIYDISRKLELSTATISRALNHSSGVSMKTRKLVSETAVKMNYRKSHLAGALQSGKSNCVGVIVPFINNIYLASIIRGIQEKLSPMGYQVVICQSQGNVENEINQLNSLVDFQVDGIFIAVSETTKNIGYIKRIVDENIPVIILNHNLEVSFASSVILDNFKAGYLAAEHLVKKGCKRISFLVGDLANKKYKDQYQGYRAALEEYNLKSHPEHILQLDNNEHSGRCALATLWKRDLKPDAIITASNNIAQGVLKEIKKQGIKIPNEVSFVEIGNQLSENYWDLTITSVCQEPVETGEIAAQLFLQRMMNVKLPIFSNSITVAPKLLLRGIARRTYNTIDCNGEDIFWARDQKINYSQRR